VAGAAPTKSVTTGSAAPHTAAHHLPLPVLADLFEQRQLLGREVRTRGRRIEPGILAAVRAHVHNPFREPPTGADKRGIGYASERVVCRTQSARRHGSASATGP
jgi:hypothetical protein